MTRSAGNNYAEPAPNINADFVYTSNKKKECNDVFFLLIWLAAVIMTVVFAVDYGDDFLNATEYTTSSISSNTGYKRVLTYLAYCGLSSVGISLGWIIVMIVAGEFLIWLALLLIIAANVMIAIFFTKRLHDDGVDAYWWPAVAFGSLALLTALYTCCIRKRIKFAAKHLKVAGSAIFSLPMTVIVAFIMVFVQFAWVITWFLGNIGIMFHLDYVTVNGDCTVTSCDIDTDLGAAFGVTAGMLLVFFWAAFTFENIVHVTVAGSVGSWKIKSSQPFITMFAWTRSITLSLGSICFGSLLVAILETIRQILNAMTWAAKDSGNCCAACIFGCISCIVGCIESLVQFFNRFAFTYVGLYGYSFLTAGKHVWSLFKNKGWSAIVNDNLTGNVFLLGKVAIAVCSAFIGVTLVDDTDDGSLSNIPEARWVVGLGAALIGYAVASIFMSVMASAVTTVFVLWAEDPHSWEISHPHHYASLHAAWQEIYPEEYNNGRTKQGNNSDAGGSRAPLSRV